MNMEITIPASIELSEEDEKALKNLTSSLYKAFCNEITGRIWFEDVPSLREIMKELREFLS